MKIKIFLFVILNIIGWLVYNSINPWISIILPAILPIVIAVFYFSSIYLLEKNRDLFPVLQIITQIKQLLILLISWAIALATIFIFPQNRIGPFWVTQIAFFLWIFIATITIAISFPAQKDATDTSITQAMFLVTIFIILLMALYSAGILNYYLVAPIPLIE